MNTANFSVNWFDGVAVGILAVGFFRGRKCGMSGGMQDLLQMVLMVVVAGLFYKPVSQFVQHLTKLSQIVAHPLSYIAILAGIQGLFALRKRRAGEGSASRDTFGRFEYSLGALAGMVRWGCGLLIALSLLSTVLVTDEENQARVARVNKELGSDYFAIFSIGFQQQSIFKRSFLGPQIKKYLGRLLIEGSPMGDLMPKRGDWKSREETDYNEMMKGGKR